MASNLASICQPGSRIVLWDQYIDTWGAGKSYRVIHQENIQGGPPGEYTGWSTWRIYRVIFVRSLFLLLALTLPTLFRLENIQGDSSHLKNAFQNAHITFGFYFWKNSKRPWNCSIFVRSLFLLLALILPTLFRLKLPNTVTGRWDMKCWKIECMEEEKWGNYSASLLHLLLVIFHTQKKN